MFLTMRQVIRIAWLVGAWGMLPKGARLIPNKHGLNKENSERSPIGSWLDLTGSIA